MQSRNAALTEDTTTNAFSAEQEVALSKLFERAMQPAAIPALRSNGGRGFAVICLRRSAERQNDPQTTKRLRRQRRGSRHKTQRARFFSARLPLVRRKASEPPTSKNTPPTPANNAINALKTGNAIVFAPSPKGARALENLLRHIHAEFDAGIARDLVSMLPVPPSKEQTAVLLRLVDFVVATGSQNNVRAATSCGTQAIGVGVGNVPVIVDETADLEHAAGCIARSKSFDNATSCSAENALVVVSSVRAAFLEALAREGGWLLDEQQVQHLTATHWREGKVQPALLAQDIAVVLERLGWTQLAPQGTRFLVAPAEKVEPPLSGEKMALFLALYSVADFAAATEAARSILEHQGAGHSVGLHSAEEDRARRLAFVLPACRVIVNQPHAVATGGDFHNRLPFSLSMGCGSWGKNAIDENLHWRHFVNRVRIVRPVADREPCLEEIFADYWSQVGK